jgi:putative ABC transport system permease protein
MSVIWDKLWSDLWHHKVRTLLASLSISIGVLALGFIIGLMDQLIPTWNRAHRAIRPASIYMHLDQRIGEEAVHALQRIDGVAGVEPMNERMIRYRLTPDEPWRDGMLIMRDNYKEQQYSLLQLKHGEWPQRNTMGIDYRSAALLGLHAGDRVIFELDGTDRALPLSGKIRYHFIASPEFGFDSHFFVDAQGLERFGVPAGEYQQLMIQVTPPYSEELARSVASEVKDKLSSIGISVGTTFYNDPDEHWAQDFFDGLSLVMHILAVTALLLSVVLIYNTLAALITQQTNQIGILKAIGARTLMIMRLYLAGVLVYGVLALLISLPLSTVLSHVMAVYFLDIFNVSYNTFQVSQRALLVQIGAALLVPLLAALIPVFNGTRITVRQAIASYGLGDRMGGTWFERTIDRLGGSWLAAPVQMALSNMFRRRSRLVLTQMVLITAGTLYLIVMTLSSSINLTVDTELARRNYHMQFVFADNHRISHLEALLENQPHITHTEAWFSHPATLLRAGQATREAGAGTLLVGVIPDSDLYRPRVVAGRWLLPGDDRALVLNEQTAEENGIQVGDMVTLDLGEMGDDSWQVVGFYRVLSVLPEPEFVYATRSALYRITTRYPVNHLLVQTTSDDPAFVEQMTRRLEILFEQRNWDIRETRTVVEDRQFFANFFNQYLPMLLILALMTALVGSIGLMGALSISVIERTREIGVLRAIGAQTPHLMRMLILEGVAQVSISWLAAVPLSFVFGQYMAALMGHALFDVNLDYRYHVWAVFFWLVAVLGIGVFASVLPARNAARISVRESLSYE